MPATRMMLAYDRVLTTTKRNKVLKLKTSNVKFVHIIKYVKIPEFFLKHRRNFRGKDTQFWSGGRTPHFIR